MLCISAAKNYQSYAVNREATDGAKTVHMQDILNLRESCKCVENKVVNFISGMGYPVVCLRPDLLSFNNVLRNLDFVKIEIQRLEEKIETSSYPHNPSKIAKLKTMRARMNSLSKQATAKFWFSRGQVQAMREREDRRRVDQTESAKARFERRQYVNQMINAGKGGELYNGGMVK